LGPTVHDLKDHRYLLDAYAKAIFGESGQARQLEEIYGEWIRIEINGETP
jgi:hypothetical protein